MCKGKFLALLLTICMVLTGIGTSGIVVNADATTVINVGQGVTYLLPDGVTSVDTSKVGYQIIEGTDGITYRVNVGEYKTFMFDDLEAYNSYDYDNAITNVAVAGGGGKFTKKAYTADTDGYSQRLIKDGDNTVLSFGPCRSNFGNARWTPTDNPEGEAFKLSFKVKVASFDTNSTTSDANTFLMLNVNGDSGKTNTSIAFRTRMDTDTHTITSTQIFATGASNSTANIDGLVNWTGTSGTVAMTDYITLDLEGNADKYSARVNGTEVVNNVAWKTGGSYASVSSFDMAKRTYPEDAYATVYIDDIVYSKAVYVTDTLESVSANASVEQGAATAQTATVALNMSDGTKKDFIVQYTADTSSLGEKKANGTIDGFDGIVPVTYTVAGVISDDFQNAQLGTLTPDHPLNGWTVTNTKGTVDDTEITFKREEYSNHHITSNNVLEINRTADDTEDSKDYVLRRALDTPVTGKDGDLMSVKFNMMRNNNNTIEFNVGLESEYIGGTAVSVFKFILVASQIYLPGSETPIYFDGKYDEYSPRVGIWHEFEILADVKNDYVYFYEQDKLLGSGRIDNAAEKIYGLSAITLESVSTGNGSFNNGGGYIWIDNINVKMLSQQDALQEAGERLGSMFRGRLSEDITLPSKGWYNTDVVWESDNSSVIDNTGRITRPESGDVISATLTATVTANGVGSEKFYYTALVNPDSVLLDESFEFPRSVNGQPMSARPLTGGLVPWHGWIPYIADTLSQWDTSATLVAENKSNNAFRLERLSGVSSDSNIYYWEKKLTEPVASDGLVSVSFRILREEGSPVIRIGLTDDWIIDIRLGTGKIYNNKTWAGAPNFEKKHNYATFGEWYNFDILVDFSNGKCYAYCDNQFIGEVGDFPAIDGYKCESVYISPSRAAAATSDSKMLIDDIVVNKLTQAEFSEKQSAYEYASSYGTMIKDVSLSRGSIDMVTIKNFEASGANSVILVAEYGKDGSTLQNIKMYNVPNESDVNAVQKVAANQAAVSGNKVAVYVWNKDTLKPLALECEILVP